MPTKPEPWDLSPEAFTSGLAREVWRNAVVAMPMWSPVADGPQWFTGRYRGLATPQVAAKLNDHVGEAGNSPDFPGVGTGSAKTEGYTTGVAVDFTAVSMFAVLELDAIDGWGRYFEICGRGSIFRNSTNWGIAFQQTASGHINTQLLAYHRSSGGALDGWRGEQNQTDAMWGSGAPIPVSVSYDGTRMRCWVDGNEHTTADFFGSSSLPTSTDPITIGAGTGHTSSSRTWNGQINSIIIADDYWSADIHRALHADWYAWLREPDSAPMFAFGAVGAPPAGARPQGPFGHPLYGPLAGPIGP